MGPNIFKSLDPSFDPATAAVTSSATFGDALLARHAIGEALNSTGRAAERRTLSQAYQDLNGAMDSALDPQQLALKQQADLLWRRSYIMDKIGQSLTKMESTQPIGTAQQIVPQSFIKTVNQLAKQDIGRNSAGNLVKKPSQLDILYDNPADKQSMVQLANFLSTKYSRLTGAGGIGEKMAQIGLIAETIHLPIQLATGNYAGAAKTAGVLSGTYILSKALARPGGPALLLHYFNSAGADAAAAATRIAMQGASNYIDNKDEPEEKPAPPPPAPPPPSVPEHIAIAERAKQQQGIQ